METVYGEPPGQTTYSSDEWRRRIHPDDRERVDGLLAAALAGQAEYDLEFRVLWPDGSVHWVAARGQVHRDEQGQPLRLVGVNIEVTDRRKAEEARRRYEQVVRQSRDVILFVRRHDGRILEANPAATEAYGYSREELLRLSIQDLRAPGTEEFADAQMEQADRGGVLFETNHRRRDGSVFPVEVSSRGTTLDGVRALVSVVRDITDRRRAEQALRDADRNKDQFLAVLSHELRNPLAAIANSLGVLERDPGGSRAARAQAIIGNQARQLARLVDDLLDVTRISRNKVRLQMQRLDLCALVRQAVEDHRLLFEDAGVRLEVQTPTASATVDADAQRLRQVVGNLLQNAAKFTPRGGSVRASVEPAAEPGKVEIQVADTGIGIPPEVRAHLFEPFAQADAPPMHGSSGLGLGLALVKGLVEQHGGTVNAHSAGVGQGAVFVVRLPLAVEEQQQAADARPAGASRSARRILVIDDNPSAAEGLGLLLEVEGHEVATATSGAEGVEMARRLRPDLVLCDIGMPGMNGYEVARSLSGDPMLAGTRLVALTGYAYEEDRRRAAEAGFHRHVAKPLSPEVLRELLDGGRSAG
jgi:PAS domain S-box-containing protein